MRHKTKSVAPYCPFFVPVFHRGRVSGAQAAVNAIEAMLKEEGRVKTIQEYHGEIKSYQKI